MNFEPVYKAKDYTYAVVTGRFLVDYDLLVAHISKLITEDFVKLNKGDIFRQMKVRVTEKGQTYLTELKYEAFEKEVIEKAKQLAETLFPKIKQKNKRAT